MHRMEINWNKVPLLIQRISIKSSELFDIFYINLISIMWKLMCWKIDRVSEKCQHIVEKGNTGSKVCSSDWSWALLSEERIHPGPTQTHSSLNNLGYFQLNSFRREMLEADLKKLNKFCLELSKNGHYFYPSMVIISVG